MAIFSTTVTQTQRDAIDFDLRGRAISQASRHNTKRPGWNAPDGYVPPTTMQAQPKIPSLIEQIIQQEQERQRQRQAGPRQAPEAFRRAGCQLFLPSPTIFLGIYQATNSDPCTTGCAFYRGGKCPAFLQLYKNNGPKREVKKVTLKPRREGK